MDTKNQKLLLLRKFVKLINDRKSDAAPTVNGVITHPDVPYMDSRLPYHTLDVYAPGNHAEKMPAVLYVHGGGWSLSDKKHFRHFCQTIAANGYVVFNVNYRLAPEYRHPSQLLDLLSAMEWVKSHACEYNADSEKTFMFGDSAGAHLASLAVCICTNDKLRAYYNVSAPFPCKSLCGCVFFCGTYDIESCVKTSFPLIKDFVRALLGTRNIGLYKDIDKLSAIKNINANFPPCLISDCVKDALIGESRSFIKALDRNQVRHKDLLLETVGKAAVHEYQIEYDQPVFDICMNEVLIFLRDCRTYSQTEVQVPEPSYASRQR